MRLALDAFLEVEALGLADRLRADEEGFLELDLGEGLRAPRDLVEPSPVLIQKLRV